MTHSFTDREIQLMLDQLVQYANTGDTAANIKLAAMANGSYTFNVGLTSAQVELICNYVLLLWISGIICVPLIQVSASFSVIDTL